MNQIRFWKNLGGHYILIVREYICLNCGKTWEKISEYRDLECPYCEEDNPEVTWKARAYD